MFAAQVDASQATSRTRGIAIVRRSRLREAAAAAVAALRARTRRLLWLAAFGFALYLLMPQARDLQRALETLGSVRWEWLLAGIAASALIYLMAALAQMGAVDQSLSLRHMVGVQVAATFVAQLTPQGLGGMGVNERYLERQGVARTTAVGAVALNMVAGAVVHALALVVVLAILGRGALSMVRLETAWLVALALLVITCLVVAVERWDIGRNRLLGPSVRAMRDMARVLRRPVRAFQLFGGSAGITASYALTLALCLQSFGAAVSPLEIAAVYLGGAAVGALIPTPGGLGAIETALLGGLTAAGVDFGPAVATVSTFRLITFWMPILPGFVLFRYLHRQHAL